MLLSFVVGVNIIASLVVMILSLLFLFCLYHHVSCYFPCCCGCAVAVFVVVVAVAVVVAGTVLHLPLFSISLLLN